MKKTFTRITALILCTLLISALALNVDVHAESSYTYNYDYWGEFTDSPDAYTVAQVFTSAELGLEKNMKMPEGITVYKDLIYVCDTGNNRILELKRVNLTTIKLERIIESFNGHENNTFNGPTDLQISEEGCFFICDKGNARILKLDKDLNYITEFVKPNDDSLAPDLVFAPSKLAIDTADRVYCISSGINKGLIKYEADGSFSGFIGSTPVTYNFWDWFWKKFIASKAQIDAMENFVPTEYENLYMDYEGFIYVCTGKPTEDDIKAETADVVRKLNLLGNDILVRNGNYPIYGDLYMGSGGNISGPSRFTDITTFDNDIYVCLDRTRGRLFGYDDQGNLVYAFGGTGNMDGYFKNVAAIDHIGYDLLVLDKSDAAITLFIPTEFGNLIYQAVDQFDLGEYDDSEQSWRKVMELNGNYDLAYIGIGRSLLRQKKYEEAMEYFKLKHDADNYSKAFKQYRKQWVEDNIVIIVIVILLLFLIPMGIGKLKSIKHEIDIADIFQ